MKKSTVLLIVMFAGAVFISVGLLSILPVVKLKKSGLKTEGIVTGTDFHGKGLMVATVSFKTAGDVEISSSARSHKHLDKGEIVDFWYDRNTPAKITFGDTVGYDMRAVYGGGLFFFLGLFYLLKYRREDQLKNKLVRSGMKVDAEVVAVCRNEKYNMGESAPWIIKCKWHDNINDIDYYFISSDFTADPAQYLGGRTLIPVFLDPSDKGKYFMDTSFIPENISI